MNLHSLLDAYGGSADDGLLETQQETTLTLPDSYGPLFEACHAVVTGAIDPQEWERVWAQVGDEIEGRLVALESALASWSGGQEHPSALSVMECLLQQLQEALGAVDSMAAFLEDRDPGILNRGWLRLVEATGAVQCALWQISLLPEM